MTSEYLPKQTTGNLTSQKEYALVIIFAVISLIFHGLFVINGFGEVDSCKLSVFVIKWHYIGKITELIDLVRQYVFYLQYLQIALNLGLPPAFLPVLMNWTNVITGSLCLIPLYYLWRQWTSLNTVLMYLLMLSFAPAFWLGNLYGMSHIPGLFFFLISLNCFSAALKKTGGCKFALLTAAFLFAVLTLGFKADLLLCFGAYMGLALFMHRFRTTHLLYAIALPILSLAFILVYQNLLFPQLSAIRHAATHWSDTFPLTFNALTDAQNIASTVTTLGIIMSLMVFIFLGYGILCRKHIKLLLFVLCWALPLALFWGLRMGNSSRHMLSPLIPLLFYAVLIIPDMFKKVYLQWSFALLILIANYYACPAGQLPRTVRPSSRIFLAHTHLQRQVSLWHKQGKDFAEFDAEKKIIIGNDYTNFVVWETLKTATDLKIGDAGILLYNQNGRPCQLKVIYTQTQNKATLDSIIADNPDWSVWSLNTPGDNTDLTLDCIYKP